MDQKRKTAIIVITIACATFFTLAVSLATGGIKVSVLTDNPINILTLMIAGLAIAAAAAVAIVFYLDKMRSCKNVTCRQHPRFVDTGDSFFKETTGLIDVAAVNKAVEEDNAKKAAEAREKSPIRQSDVSSLSDIEDEVIDGSLKVDVRIFTSPTLEEAGRGTRRIEPPNNISTVPITKPFRTTADDIEDVEEPRERSDMDFTDEMIPLITSALCSAKIESERFAGRELGRELSGQAAAIGKLVEEQLASGLFAGQTATPSTRRGEAALAVTGQRVEKISDYKRRSGKHFRQVGEHKSRRVG